MRAESMSAGCLCIDDITSGTSDPSGPFLFRGLSGVETWPFRCPEGENLWDGLRVALQALRKRWETVGVAAQGTGCAAALALAEQLPVDRLALVDPLLSIRGTGRGGGAMSADARVLRRIAAFARRNLSLCVSDTLIVETGADCVDCRRLADALSTHCRVERIRFDVKTGEKLYKIREIEVKQAISRFLQAGERQKPLAENPEMCIIYG